MLAGGLWWTQHQFDQVPTFGDPAAAPGEDEAEELAEPLEGVTTFLVFSTGAEDMTAEEARRYGITDFAAREGDGLTDSIILAVLDMPSRELTLLSIPRDTWMDDRGSRINETYRDVGPYALAADVREITGIPVNHLVAVNFTAAARLTDVVGGIDIEIPLPMRDRQAHLELPEAGCVHLDGKTALAFSRSRHTQVQQDGVWRTDASASDFGRSARQQAAITAALRKLLSPKLPLYVDDLAEAAQDTLTIDRGLELGHLVSTGRALATGPELEVRHLGLPSRHATVGQAAVTRVDPGPAREILAPLLETVPGASLPEAYEPEPWEQESSEDASADGDDRVEATGGPEASGEAEATGEPRPTAAPGMPTSEPAEVVDVEGFETGGARYAPCTDGATPPSDASASD